MQSHQFESSIPSNPNRRLLTPSLRINRTLPTHLTRLHLLLLFRSFDSIARIDEPLHQERPADYTHTSSSVEVSSAENTRGEKSDERLEGMGEELTESDHQRHKQFPRPAHTAEVVGYGRSVVGFEVSRYAAYGVGFAEDAGELLEGSQSFRGC
jgi:hypothetical protein